MNTNLLAAVIAVGLSLNAATTSAQSADAVKSSDEIASALEPPKTRSLTRGVSVRVKAKVDLNVPFDFNSSDLTPEAERQLEQLSEALMRESLSTSRFEIAGHTDAAGSPEWNHKLSEERAASVMGFLIDKGISADRLESVGHGEEQLLKVDDPLHPANRRVEIRNLGASSGQ